MRWRECAPSTTRLFLVVSQKKNKKTDATQTKEHKKYKVFLCEICLPGLFFFSYFFWVFYLLFPQAAVQEKNLPLAGQGGRRGSILPPSQKRPVPPNSAENTRRQIAQKKDNKPRDKIQARK